MKFDPLRVTLAVALLAAVAGVAACTGAGGGGPFAAPAAAAPGLAGAIAGDALPACRPGADELWIFAEGPRTAAPRRDQQGPGTGDMVGRAASGAVLPLPLQRTGVRAQVRGYVSTVDVEQRFHNPYAEKIEAVYVFPLPDDAAVRDFVMQIGERRIRGIIRRKEEAKQIYVEARAQGYRASLLEQARPNVFEQSVANLEPGTTIDVHLQYAHTLAYGAGAYEFVFPMVVGPRYNPAGWTQGIGALAAGDTSSPQPTNVAYLPPEIRSGHDVALTVDVDAGLPIGDVGSPSHPIEVERQGANRATARLAAGTTIPNRDFVLRYAIAGDDAAASLFTHRDASGGYLTLMLQPPSALRQLPRQPMEMTFLVDCSGSMAGAPLDQARAAIELALQQLGPADAFQIVRFSTDASAFAPAAVPVNGETLAAARSYLAGLAAQGGTEMVAGVRAALRAPRDAERRRFVVLLTDGFIGNESQVFDVVRGDLGAARVVAIGIGSSVNRYLLEGAARLGRGAVGYLLHDEPPGRVVAQLYERLGHPALCDLQIDWGGALVDEVFPARLPDLFVGRPVVVTARFRGEPPQRVRLRGTVGGGSLELDAVPAAADGDGLAALPALWARRKIQSLSDFAEVEGRAGDPARVEELALAYGLMSAFTSFVAVDAGERTAGDHGTTVRMPVPTPAGVRYDTAVGGR